MSSSGRKLRPSSAERVVMVLGQTAEPASRLLSKGSPKRAIAAKWRRIAKGRLPAVRLFFWVGGRRVTPRALTQL